LGFDPGGSVPDAELWLNWPNNSGHLLRAI
jgi:hypothetical protein